MWAGSENIPKTKKSIRKLHPVLVAIFIVVALGVLIFDLSLGEFKIRPDKSTEVQLYASLIHIIPVIGMCILLYQVYNRAVEVGARVLGMGASILVACILLYFWVGLILKASTFPNQTYQFEEYDKAYFVYPQTALLRRKGCQVFEATGEYTMERVGGAFAVSLDTSYVSNDTFYIGFRGANKILWGRKPDHWFQADLIGGYSVFY